MSLDETGKSVWQTKETPLVMFVASRLTKIAAVSLPPAAQETFGALSETLVAWWPKCERQPTELHEQEYSACLRAYENYQPAAKMEPALTGAYLQMAGLLRWIPFRCLPADRYYEMREADFLSWLRIVAKIGRLPVAQLEARLKLFLDHRKSWSDLIVCADRMHWGRSGKWSKLSYRARDVAKLADLGATASWISIEGQKALQLELDGIKRIAVLNSEELASLESLIPLLNEQAD